MEKITSVLFLFTVHIFSACIKEEDPEPTGPSVSFKVNGTLKQARQFRFGIQNYKGVGDYDVADADNLATYATEGKFEADISVI